MKNTDKVTLSIGQLKKLIKESNEDNRLLYCFENVERCTELTKWYIDELKKFESAKDLDEINYKQYKRYLISSADDLQYWAKQVYQETVKLSNEK